MKRAAGVEPLTSPPFSFTDLDLTEFQGQDLLYFKLHGVPGQAYWYGDRWTTAISADQIRCLNLKRTVVFVANCHLYRTVHNATQPEPMLQALLDAGARAVVGGPGVNYAGRRKVFGADLLGMIFRQVFKATDSPKDALNLAKIRLRQCRQDRVTRDTLEFRLFT